jgi:hypothetical protein
MSSGKKKRQKAHRLERKVLNSLFADIIVENPKKTTKKSK